GLGEHLDDLTRFEPPALGNRRAVDEHRPVRDEILDVSSRPAGEQRDRAVDPLPRERHRYRELFVHGCARSPQACRSRVVLRIDHTTTSTAPIVMAESATLNVGQRPMSTKSITAPRRNPGERNTRSMRFPIAPPSKSESATTSNVSVVRRTVRTRTYATQAAMTASNGVNAWNRLNAPPVLRASWKFTV